MLQTYWREVVPIEFTAQGGEARDLALDFREVFARLLASNRSLAIVEPVSGSLKMELEKPEQRRARQTRPLGTVSGEFSQPQTPVYLPN